MAKHKADLFAFLEHMCDGDYAYIDRMTDEDVKSLSPYVLTMWANGATKMTPERVVLTDLFCNSMVFRLADHPRLLLKLFVAANEGMGSSRFKFKKTTSISQSKLIRRVADYYKCGAIEAKDTLTTLTEDDIVELNEIYGD